MNDPGFESLLPPLVAIVLAIATRRVVVPLAVGVAVGAGLIQWTGASDQNAVWVFGETAYHSVFGRDHLMALAFSLLLGAMVGVLEYGGSMAAVVDRMASWLHRGGEYESDGHGGRCRAQRLIAATGLVIFFDDYANTLLVGGTMRSTADRYKLSREKLAYLVDSTSAPIAGLSVISTWAAIEMSYMGEGLASAGIESNAVAFELFVRSIPYRFYPILALVMVAVVVWTGRDFGPMRDAEQTAFELVPETGEDDGVSAATTGHRNLHWAAIAPVTLCLVSVLAVLLATGAGSPEGIAEAGDGPISALMRVMGAGDAYLALVIGGAVGVITSLRLHRWLGDVDQWVLGAGVIAGVRQMMPAMVILWLAWALGETTATLQTGQYLANLLSAGLPPVLLPTMVFVVAGGVAFSTGTSWGTMGLLTPLAVRLSIEFARDGGVGDAAAVVGDPLVLATSGAVLAGAIFGDHCSPISDTTVLSSRSSGCDHLAHVRTQLPYAITVGGISILLGTLPAAYGMSPWIAIALGSAAIWAMMRISGRQPGGEAACG